MKKRLLLSLSISLILCILFTIAVSAYGLASSRPSSKSLSWRYHSTLTSAGQGPAASAAGSWCSIGDGFTATYSFSSYTGTIDPTDTKNSVGGRVASIPGVGSGWIAATLCPEYNYTTFDIVINSNRTFGNGTGATYYDYQGVFTHEFGHVFGLADLYPLSQECIGKIPSTLPSMYGYAEFGTSTNIYYELRSLEQDDKNGKSYVASLIN